MLLTIVTGWLHVMFAVAVVGGGFFNAFILVPKFKNLEAKVAGQLQMAVGSSFTVVVWTSIAGLFLTGMARASFDKGFSTTFGFSTDYGVTMNIKLFLFVLIVINAFIITRTAKSIPATDPKDRPMLSDRVMKLSILNIILGTLIVLLAQVLRYGGSWF